MAKSKIADTEVGFNALPFEEVLSELEKISENLRSGKMSLADAVASYKRGMQLSKIADKQLLEAEVTLRTVGEDQNQVEERITSAFHNAKHEFLENYSKPHYDIEKFFSKFRSELDSILK